ncbi:MAG: hypothetical protein ACREH6_08800, partial [Geminicoccaceae bacterium]
SINLLFASDVMTNSGFIVPKDVELSTTDSLTLYFKAASRLDFSDYAHAILYPYYTEGSPETTFDQLTELTSLKEIGDYLHNSKKIGLMHNEDDVTLAEGDIGYLETIFGDRAQIYPKGGHCGNMAYTDNVAYVIDFFSN